MTDADFSTLNGLPVACLGGGVIGASWATLFAACGCRVTVYDPADGAGEAIAAYAARAWPSLQALGVAKTEAPPEVPVVAAPEDAVEGARFIQESAPERIEIKHDLYRRVEPALAPDAVVASSASGLTVTEMQGGWKDPARFVLGHPFNPPHLIPLVEVMGNERTEESALTAAEAFYAACGKTTIRVNKEVPGHVANRLQAALWREAVSLVQNGVASVEDVDRAIWAGPGLRWAAMGPHMLFGLGAGEAGMAEFCRRYAPSFHRWWESLDDGVTLDEETAKALADGVAAEMGGRSTSEMMAERDRLILGFLKAAQRG
ncbi:MAG: 3-hydroxyacyl-CoA dehydrogenase NAD-binding domain-containing protein [Marivibrio sp.]|uniref:3-hydroxyacyl-CoA dehydrogenase NAD-binding domain-containing protein n=1 Tax=Marivibrio sp. TaxID=2039719 RepID=UPI0032EC13F5